MSNYMDYLDEQLDSSSVLFHEFMLAYKKGSHNPICFVEGFDDSYYYRIRVETLCNCNAVFIPCGGKQKVLDIYEEIQGHSEYRNCKLFYFVDKDFDEKVLSNDIYVTPTYSIENFYTSEKCFKKIIADIFHRNENDVDYKKVVALFRKRQSEFHTSVLELNALIAFDRGTQKSIQNRISLSEVDIVDYVSIDIFEIKKLESMDQLLEKFSHIDNSDKTKKVMEFSRVDKQKSFRGKFEFQFFCKLLDRLSRDSNVRKQEKRLFFTQRVKNELDLSKNALSTLTSFADTPSCLHQYITRTWNSKPMELVS